MARRRDGKQVGFVVVGLGHIAQHAVLPAFAHAPEARLVALVSDDAEKREKLSRKYRCDAAPERDLDEVLARPDVQAAYIALPNDLHADAVVRCARAGVHVVCEKPLGVSEEECRRMIDACDEAGVRLMTAYRLHFDPANLALVQLVEDGRLGDLRLFSSTFGYQIRPGNIRTSAERGGGAVWDLGVYCVNAARYLFRSEPIEVKALRAERPQDPRFEDVHEGLAALLRFPEDRLATFSVSFDVAAQDELRLVGTKGSAELQNAYDYEAPRTLRVTVDGKTQTRRFKQTDQFAPELSALARAVLEDAPLEPDGEEGLRDVRIISALLRSARDGRSVRMAWGPRPRRPEPKQATARPAVHDAMLVHVQAPTID